MPRHLNAIIKWVAVAWVLIVVGALVASAPSAWKTLSNTDNPESKVVAWAAILMILTLPVIVVLIYLRHETQKEREVVKWLHNDLRPPAY